MASEVGDRKREIVYFGDTINTAARIVAMCKTLNERLLVTDTLLEDTSRPAGLRVRSLGAHALAGKEQTVALSAVELPPPLGADDDA